MKNFLTFPFRKIRKKAKKTKLSPMKNRKRVGRSLFIVIISVFMIFIFRYVWLVTTHQVAGNDIGQLAKFNYMQTINVPAKRGTIYDRNGTEIAVDSSTYKIYAVIDKNQKSAKGQKNYVPKEDFDKVASFLNQNLGIDKNLALQQLNLNGSQVEFGSQGNQISLSKMESLQKGLETAKITGIYFSPQLARSYPLNNFASQFIGIASPQDNQDGTTSLVGQNGLELSFNQQLSGTNGVETYQKDMYGRPVPNTTHVITPVVNGQDVYTTLDATLQSNLEKLMDTAMTASGGQQMSATLMNAHTGEILATSQCPTFTAQTYNKASSQQYFTWNNQLYQNAFEPGSTMKTFLMASALDSNKVDLNATYSRTLKAYDVTINDWDWNEHGHFTLPSSVTFAQGFEMSSNVGMSKIEMNMGNPTWDDYLNRFRFGVRTRLGMGVPGVEEGTGALPTDNAVSQIQSAFGQGISVTQAQLLRGWTSFANDGTMLEPHVVSKIYDSNNNQTYQSEPEVIGHPISANVASQVRNLMVGVNTDPFYGTSYLTVPLYGKQPGPLFMVNNQPMAVKTGTAQIAAPTGGYMTGDQDYIYSAVAMYPPQNPDFIFYMNIKIPSSPWYLGFISDVANPMMTQAESMKASLQNISNTGDQGTITLKDYKNNNSGDTADALRRELLAPVLVGMGSNIKAQSISSGTKVGTNTRLLLLTDGDQIMPDMYSWSKDQVDQVANWYGLKINYEGSGNSVVKQSITIGNTVKNGQTITITMG